MTSRHSPQLDRAVRLELLCARAAVERDALGSQFVRVGRSLEPSALLRGLSSSGAASSLLGHAISLIRRNPILLSSLPALLAAGKRSRLLKLGGLGFVAWRAMRFLGGARRRTPTGRR